MSLLLIVTIVAYENYDFEVEKIPIENCTRK